MAIQPRTTKTLLNEDQRWVAPSGIADLEVCETYGLDRSAFDLVTAFPNGYLPSGIVLGLITATKLLGPYSDAGGGGLDTAVGFLAVAQVLGRDEAATSDILVPLYWRGVVDESFLPTGHGLTAAAKADLASKFVFV